MKTERTIRDILMTTLMSFALLGSLVSGQEMPKPSEEHKILMKDVGEWTIKGKVLMPTGMQEFTAEEKIVAIGGFWTVSHYSSELFGGFTGSSTLGYDPVAKAFVGTWVDSFQPAVTQMKGSYDKKTKTMTLATTGIGMDGKPMAGKIIIQYKDKDSHTFTMMHKDPTGETDKMVETMVMNYTRKVKK